MHALGGPLFQGRIQAWADRVTPLTKSGGCEQQSASYMYMMGTTYHLDP